MIMFVKDLTVIDAAYLCPQRGIVGESWLVDVELRGELNEMSMLFDFARVKKQIKALLDADVDHRLLVPQQAPETLIEPAQGGYLYIDFLAENKTFHLHCPEQSFAIIPSAAITIASVTEYLQQRIMAVLPDNVEGLTLTLHHESIETPIYHYTHGLKKHDGNCQRIAHGHRSTIEIYVDDQRDKTLEAEWCKRWTDIYLGTQEDCVPVTTLAMSQTAQELMTDDLYYGFRYTSAQGEFQLAMPKDSCEVLDTDTTVELLADHIARVIKVDFPAQTIRVVAYEGVGKGAIAEQ
jgi:6-pyruvoyl-tetrahydropterin synthase